MPRGAKATTRALGRQSAQALVWARVRARLLQHRLRLPSTVRGKRGAVFLVFVCCIGVAIEIRKGKGARLPRGRHSGIFDGAG